MPMELQPKGNAAYISRLNKVKVLELIQRRGNISRAQVAHESGLSAPTVTRIVEGLIREEKLVQEAGFGHSEGGRPPIMIQLSNDTNAVVGIDLGTTAIRGVLANLSGGILADVEKFTPVEEGFDAVMESVIEVVRRLLNTEPARQKRIHGIGMAVAGLINKKSKLVEFSPDFNWENVDIHQALKGRIEHPVIFDNVTRVMATGELRYGRGHDYKNFACVNLGYGIGAGIISDGRAFVGAEGFAGEFGHITVDPKSNVRCMCGNYGCLEALASGSGIARAACDAIESGAKSTLDDLCSSDHEQITAEMVFRAAESGDSLSNKVIDTAVEYLGIGIASLVNLFDPEAVFMGGAVAQPDGRFWEAMCESARRRMLPRHKDVVEILPVSHGTKAAVMGAVCLAANEVLLLKVQA